MRMLCSPLGQPRRATLSFIALAAAQLLMCQKVHSAGTASPAEFQVDEVVLIVLAQADGKILVPGESVRLNSDGTVDTSYKLAISGRVEAAALQSDGKCLIGHSDGVDEFYQRVPLLQRYNPDGSLDPNFATTLSDIDVIADIAVQP